MVYCLDWSRGRIEKTGGCSQSEGPIWWWTTVARNVREASWKVHLLFIANIFLLVTNGCKFLLTKSFSITFNFFCFRAKERLGEEETNRSVPTELLRDSDGEKVVFALGMKKPSVKVKHLFCLCFEMSILIVKFFWRFFRPQLFFFGFICTEICYF